MQKFFLFMLALLSTYSMALDQMRVGNGTTDLMVAASNGDRDLVEVLLESGAAVNAKDRHGNTALMYAVWKKNDDVVGMLTRSGADRSIVNNNGKRALEIKDEKDLFSTFDPDQGDIKKNLAKDMQENSRSSSHRELPQRPSGATSANSAAVQAAQTRERERERKARESQRTRDVQKTKDRDRTTNAQQKEPNAGMNEVDFWRNELRQASNEISRLESELREKRKQISELKSALQAAQVVE